MYKTVKYVKLQCTQQYPIVQGIKMYTTLEYVKLQCIASETTVRRTIYPYLSRIAICVAGSVSPCVYACVYASVRDRQWDQSETATWQLRPIRNCHVSTSSNQNLPRGNFVQSESATWQLRPIGNCHVATSSNHLHVEGYILSMAFQSCTLPAHPK